MKDCIILNPLIIISFTRNSFSSEKSKQFLASHHQSLAHLCPLTTGRYRMQQSCKIHNGLQKQWITTRFMFVADIIFNFFGVNE